MRLNSLCLSEVHVGMLAKNVDVCECNLQHCESDRVFDHLRRKNVEPMMSPIRVVLQSCIESITNVRHWPRVVTCFNLDWPSSILAALARNDLCMCVCAPADVVGHRLHAMRCVSGAGIKGPSFEGSAFPHGLFSVSS